MTRTHFELREYLSKREATVLLDCSMRTVDRAIAAGKFTVIRGAQIFDPVKVDRLSFAAFVGDVSKLRFDAEPYAAPVAAPRVSASKFEAHDPEPAPTAPEPIDTEAYTDSWGNKIKGNMKHNGFKSVERNTRPSTTDHMMPGTVTEPSAERSGLESDTFLDAWRAPGTPTQDERRAVMRKDTMSESDRARQAYLRAINTRHPGFSR